MLATVDPRDLRELGWKKRTSKKFIYPRHPRTFELVMFLSGGKLKHIVVRDPGGGNEEDIYRGHRGFVRHVAKKRLDGKAFKEVEAVMEELHQRFHLTM